MPDLGLTMDKRDNAREPGFYWVLERGDDSEWKVAEWVRGFGGYPIPWTMTGETAFVYSDEFAEIDERRLVRVLP